jgi:hypothetical protein
MMFAAGSPPSQSWRSPLMLADRVMLHGRPMPAVRLHKRGINGRLEFPAATGLINRRGDAWRGNRP